MTQRDETVQDELDEVLDELDAALDSDDVQAARALLARATEIAGADHPDVAFGEANLVWIEQGPAAAAEPLARVIELDPSHADAHYGLACSAQERGLEELAIEHNLHVLRLDAREARQAQLATRERLDFIEGVAERVLHALPEPFPSRLAHVPVVLEARPALDLVQDGFDPRALGLFDGPTDAEPGVAAPTRIVLYTHNLLADFPDDTELEDEVEITLMHEIGHFFGLDEADMQRLGLD